MVVSFNPAMSTGNTIAFGKSESKGTLPRVSMNSIADTVELKQVARESEGFFAKAGRYFRNTMRAGAFAGALVACDPTGIGNEIENPKLLSSAELLQENLDLINLGGSGSTKSATASGTEVAGYKAVSSNLLNPKFEAINPDGTSAGRIEAELFDVVTGKTDTLKYWFKEYLPGGTLHNVGLIKGYEQASGDGKTQNFIIEKFGSLSGKYGSAERLYPVSTKYEYSRSGNKVVQKALQAAKEVVNYTADEAQNVAKQELTDLGYTRKILRR